SRKNLKATLFFVGWIAERYPELVKTAVNEGHEIGSHGYYHIMLHKFNSREDFREDLRSSISILKSLSGQSVVGFRAPTFSVIRQTMWALPIMFEEGIRYDSSVFPIYHDRYGVPDAPRKPYMIYQNQEDGILEYPMSTVQLASINIPFSGGGYFRVYPLKLSIKLMERCQKEGLPVIFYAHPWEFDQNLPEVRLGIVDQLRHSFGINSILKRMDIITEMFPFTSFRDANLMLQKVN
ncbi:MAG: DUF3473 domain-containing protein, partial [Aliifodinibius sp.]|nr:DUF3473 domain-containing protein [Fodinibius sp.]NIV16593.1 DUF3473 domain-containing protein [Fodinibius sp.]NIY30575.1 DUF3473 domain-containing protein [Fodinibius sp.]